MAKSKPEKMAEEITSAIEEHNTSGELKDAEYIEYLEEISCDVESRLDGARADFERKKAEEELEAAREALAQSQKLQALGELGVRQGHDHERLEYVGIGALALGDRQQHLDALVRRLRFHVRHLRHPQPQVRAGFVPLLGSTVDGERGVANDQRGGHGGRRQRAPELWRPGTRRRVRIVRGTQRPEGNHRPRGRAGRNLPGIPPGPPAAACPRGGALGPPGAIH